MGEILSMPATEDWAGVHALTYLFILNSKVFLCNNLSAEFFLNVAPKQCARYCFTNSFQLIGTINI